MQMPSSGGGKTELSETREATYTDSDVSPTDESSIEDVDSPESDLLDQINEEEYADIFDTLKGVDYRSESKRRSRPPIKLMSLLTLGTALVLASLMGFVTFQNESQLAAFTAGLLVGLGVVILGLYSLLQISEKQS